MVVSFAGCKNTTGGSKGTTSKEPVELTLWVFNELHLKMYEFGEKAYNEKHSDAPIKVNMEVYPNADMHNKLLIAYQSGTGAPDIADLNLNFFTNFVSGGDWLAPLNDVVEKAFSNWNFEKSRFELYKIGDNYYGLPTHVGATVVYYNMEIIEKAGLTIEDINKIETWDQYCEIGKTVLEKTGIPMTCFETQNQRPFWPLIVQHGGDYLTKESEVILDSDSNIEVLEYMKKMWDDGIAIAAGGGSTAAEEFFTFMDSGSVASLIMPAWYMSRFLSYMPNLKGKIAIRPMPVFKAGEPRTVGIGGTATAVSKSSKYLDIAKEFLYESKLTYDAAVNIWESLAFDPVNLDAWKDEKLLKPSEYFYNESFFEIMAPYMSGAVSPANAKLSADAQDVVMNSVMPDVFISGSKTPREALVSAANELRAKQ